MPVIKLPWPVRDGNPWLVDIALRQDRQVKVELAEIQT